MKVVPAPVIGFLYTFLLQSSELCGNLRGAAIHFRDAQQTRAWGTPLVNIRVFFNVVDAILRSISLFTMCSYRTMDSSRTSSVASSKCDSANWYELTMPSSRGTCFVNTSWSSYYVFSTWSSPHCYSSGSTDAINTSRW